MPQLMPLMWLGSIFISLFILMVLFNMFYYSKEMVIDLSESKMYFKYIMMW